jgi:hypothetical protein
MSHSSCVDPERADMSCAHSTGRASSERNASARCGAAASAAVQRSWVAEGNLSDALSDIGRLNSRRLQKSAVPTGRCTYVLRGQLLETSRPDRPARCSRPHAAGGTHALGSSSPPYPTALRPPPPSDLDRGASRSFPPAGDRGTRLACAEPEWLAQLLPVQGVRGRSCAPQQVLRRVLRL